MIYDILGFSQEKLLGTDLDILDLMILTYIRNANGEPTMKHVLVDEVSYVWLSHKKFHEDYPFFKMPEGTFRNKLYNLKKNGWILSTTVKYVTGSKSYYSLSAKATSLHSDIGCHSTVTPDKTLTYKELDNTSTNVEVEQPAVTHEQPKRRIKLIDTVSDNNISTIANNTDTISKPDRKKSMYEKCAEYIDTYTQDSKLHSILIEYLKFRLAVKEKPIYLPQWRSMVNTLDDLTDNIVAKYKIVQQSLNGGYLKFFELKKYTSNYSNKKKFAEGDGLILGRDENEELSDEVF